METLPQDNISSAAASQKQRANGLTYVIIGLLVIALGVVCCIGVFFLGATALVSSFSNSYQLQVKPQERSLGRLAVNLQSAQRKGDYYIVELQIKNTSAQDLTFNSSLQLELRDKEKRKYYQDFSQEQSVPNEKLPSQIPAGGSIIGKVIFSAPSSPNGLRLIVYSDSLRTSSAELKLTE